MDQRLTAILPCNEFALNGPDETPVRVGWPARLRGVLDEGLSNGDKS